MQPTFSRGRTSGHFARSGADSDGQEGSLKPLSVPTEAAAQPDSPLSCRHRLVSRSTAVYEVPVNFDPVKAGVPVRPMTCPSHQVGEADFVNAA